MLKLTFCLRRLPHLSLEEFHRYWREEHGPLMEKHRAALGYVYYAQVHRVADELGDAVAAARGGPAPYDGIVEVG